MSHEQKVARLGNECCTRLLLSHALSRKLFLIWELPFFKVKRGYLLSHVISV